MSCLILHFFFFFFFATKLCFNFITEDIVLDKVTVHSHNEQVIPSNCQLIPMHMSTVAVKLVMFKVYCM